MMAAGVRCMGHQRVFSNNDQVLRIAIFNKIMKDFCIVSCQKSF